MLIAKRSVCGKPGAALRALALAVVAIVGLAASVPAAAGVPPLVDVPWLQTHLRDPGLVVLDTRYGADGAGAAAFAAAHIPGSIHSDYDRAGWRVARNGVPFMVPTAAELERLIGDLGIDETSHVVVVPAGRSVFDFGGAARVYWTLKYVGVKKVSILNGGVAAWVAAGLPVERGVKTPSPTIFSATIDASLVIDAAGVEAIANAGGATLIDARPPSFFLGKEKASVAAAYGRLPGAINVDSSVFFDPATFKLKPPAELAKAAAAIPQGPVVSYCNTGHWAATDWFVLHELLGRKDVRMFPGSMVEWASKPERPIESSRTKWDDLKRKLGFGS